MYESLYKQKGNGIVFFLNLSTRSFDLKHRILADTSFIFLWHPSCVAITSSPVQMASASFVVKEQNKLTFLSILTFISFAATIKQLCKNWGIILPVTG